MNERIKELAEQAFRDTALYGGSQGDKYFDQRYNENFAELIIKDMAKELFVVYPGGKRGSNVEFQNISMRQWIKQVYGVDLDI